MLPNSFRLRADRDITRVLKSGRWTRGDRLTIKYLPNNLPQSRFCFVVSNKVSKKSSQRNLLKRRLREIVRLHRERVQPGFDVVVLANNIPAVLAAPYRELNDELGALFSRAQLLI